jgi:hypothetical protein
MNEYEERQNQTEVVAVVPLDHLHHDDIRKNGSIILSHHDAHVLSRSPIGQTDR